MTAPELEQLVLSLGDPKLSKIKFDRNLKKITKRFEADTPKESVALAVQWLKDVGSESFK